MPVYPVQDTAKFISGVFTRPYVVKNSGVGTVYLGQDSSLTPATRAFSLPSGSALNWSGETELWAIADAGTSGELEILYTGENSFTPGPSSVSVLSDSEALFDGSVSLPSGSLVQVLDTTALSAYQTLVIKVGDQLSFSGVDTSDCRLFVEWLTVSGVLVKEEAPFFFISGSLEYHVQVIAPRVRISIRQSSGNPVIRPCIVLGLSAQLPHYYRQFPGNSGQFINCSDAGSVQTVNAKMIQLLTSTVAGVTGLVYPESLAGEAFFTGASNASGQTKLLLSVAAFNAPNNNNTIRPPYPAPMEGNVNDRRYAFGPIIVPEAPIVVRFDVTGAGLATGAANIYWT